VKDTWYAYRIIGIDIFGRHSIPSDTTTILVRDIFSPPPPLLISAKFLDPKDPYLQKEEKEWVANTDTESIVCIKGFRVIWKWTENLQIQAPDAKKFGIYFKPGLLNALEGGVVAVTCFEDSENKGLHLEGKIVEVNNNEVTMEINAENAIAIDNDPSGRFFKYDGNFFEITGISCSCDDINNIQKIVFTTKRGVSLQANKPVSLEILKIWG